MKTVLTHHSVRYLADTLTPVSAYLNLRDHFPGALLLESSDYHSTSDSLSYICLAPLAGFEASGLRYRTEEHGVPGTWQAADRPRQVWTAFKAFMDGYVPEEGGESGAPAGFFGYSSFEAAQYMEDIRFPAPADELKEHPDLRYQLFRFVLRFDHFRNELCIHEFTPAGAPHDPGELHRIYSLLRAPRIPHFTFRTTGPETSPVTDAEYLAMVRRGIAHCHRGDVFQVVMSREFRQPYAGDDFNVYRSIRHINPSPYLFYFDYGQYRIFGSSPESQIQVSGGRATIHPIAGTVRRSGEDAEDQRRAESLRRDPKENAEHIMLVDLARNDLSRSADAVQVEVRAEIQYFSHVIHMVSKVSGALRDGLHGADVYADTFPAGTLSGAPKHRAMQIIGENEPHRRNFYGGSIGFFGLDGTVNHAIIIRSVLSTRNHLILQAGAGVVAASTPENELQEVHNKVAAMRKAVQYAETL